MSRKCTTCQHPERERIEAAIANSVPRSHNGLCRLSRQYGIPRASLERHRDKHMTQAQTSRLRLSAPNATDEAIEEIVRKGGESAVLALIRIAETSRVSAAEAKKIGLHDFAIKYEAQEIKCHELLAKYAGMIPGRKTVTNNSLVLGDVTHVFDMIEATLRPFPEAQRAVARMFAAQSTAVLEHQH